MVFTSSSGVLECASKFVSQNLAVRSFAITSFLTLLPYYLLVKVLMAERLYYYCSDKNRFLYCCNPSLKIYLYELDKKMYYIKRKDEIASTPFNM